MITAARGMILRSATETLNLIETTRKHQHRQNIARRWLQKVKRWECFWRFMGLRKPTRSNVARDYYSEETFVCDKNEVEFSYCYQEQMCREAIDSVLLCHSKILSIPAEMAREIRLIGHVPRADPYASTGHTTPARSDFPKHAQHSRARRRKRLESSKYEKV